MFGGAWKGLDGTHSVSGFAPPQPLGLGGTGGPAARNNLHLVGDVVPEGGAPATAEALFRADPALAKLAVRVGYVYTVVGVNEAGTQIEVYSGQAKVVLRRIKSSTHPARAFLRA